MYDGPPAGGALDGGEYYFSGPAPTSAAPCRRRLPAAPGQSSLNSMTSHWPGVVIAGQTLDGLRNRPVVPVDDVIRLVQQRFLDGNRLAERLDRQHRLLETLRGINLKRHEHRVRGEQRNGQDDDLRGLDLAAQFLLDHGFAVSAGRLRGRDCCSCGSRNSAGSPGTRRPGGSRGAPLKTCATNTRMGLLSDTRHLPQDAGSSLAPGGIRHGN